METKVGKFSFKVPEGHPEVGKKVEKTFEYDVVHTLEEAQHVMTHSKDGKPRTTPWSLVAMVNDNLQANARSSAYQTALLPYKTLEVSAEAIQERMIKDAIRSGLSEDVARKFILGMLAAKAETVETT